MSLDLAYARALLAAAPLSDLVRAVARRARVAAWPARPTWQDDDEARRLAADALARAPRLFTAAPIAEPYHALFPDGVERLKRRARQILAHRVELFGRIYELGSFIDWLRDPATGVRFDGDGEPGAVLRGLLEPHGGHPRVDPKIAWELQRSAHLVELAAAARVHPDLEAAARDEISAQVSGFFDQVQPGRGFAYASPLEVALRSIHWLAAIELSGGARVFPRAWVERCGGALVADLQWLWAHKEEQGVAPANHLLGELVGAWLLALALDGAPGARPLIPELRRALEREAARQVGADGAHFEASTGYHRFALELLLVAHQYARSSPHALEVAGTLRRMFLYLRGTLQPDGTDPGFGDADDARLIPIVPRHPRQHAYLLPVGAALFGGERLRAPKVSFSEEALWLAGPEAHGSWQALRITPDAPSARFESGGVHVLRARDLYVALRAGSYGQHGVGGHAHNDQLSLVVHAGGAPLLIDAGTGCYTQDRLLRNRLRATCAHSTVIVDGAEQSPLYDGRLFALPDQARASRVLSRERGSSSSLTAAHHGYRRLPARVTHCRRVTLHRSERVLIIEDRLEGRGEVGVDVRFLVAGAARSPSQPTLEQRSRIRGVLDVGDREDAAGSVELGGRAALVRLGCLQLVLRLGPGLASPRWGTFAAATLVSLSGRLTLPAIVRHALVFLEPR